MNKLLSITTIAVAAFAAGVAFVAACESQNDSGPGVRLPGFAGASAQSGQCSAYEVQLFDPDTVSPDFDSGAISVPLPAGWTPLSWNVGNGTVLMARCQR